MRDHPLKSAIQRVVREQNCDIYLYAGDIERQTCGRIINIGIETPRSRALLILSSFGGDAHAAYRLTRHMQDEYNGMLTLFIPTVCKSAGTLVAIGADELVMSPHGELGPLDVQVSERDELWERRSGLVPTQALETIREEAFTFFEQFFLSLIARSGSQITTITAAEIASQLTIGLFEPFVDQIDPLRVADIRLSMRIAEEYGTRLRTENVKEGTIRKLVYEYPSHGFVLDKKEAISLFENVRTPTPAEIELADVIAPIVDEALDLDKDALALHLSDEEFLALLRPQDDPTEKETQDNNSQREEDEFAKPTRSQEGQT